jgi:hypothetical protein
VRGARRHNVQPQSYLGSEVQPKLHSSLNICPLCLCSLAFLLNGAQRGAQDSGEGRSGSDGMTTTYENMVLKEAIDQEAGSKKKWGRSHFESSVFPIDSEEYAKLDSLKSKVADLCDLQPTPSSMLRPQRKVTPLASSSSTRPAPLSLALYVKVLRAWLSLGRRRYER